MLSTSFKIFRVVHFLVLPTIHFSYEITFFYDRFSICKNFVSRILVIYVNNLGKKEIFKCLPMRSDRIVFVHHISMLELSHLVTT